MTKESLGKTIRERINAGSLPVTNSAEYETKVKLAKDQNLVSGKIAPQRKWEKLDSANQGRAGGGTQTITNGGYKSGAIINNDTKFPVANKPEEGKDKNMASLKEQRESFLKRMDARETNKKGVSNHSQQTKKSASTAPSDSAPQRERTHGNQQGMSR